MEYKCTGYWYKCDCSDCKEVSNLYAELEYYKLKGSDFEEEVEDIERKINSMGYSC